MSSDDEEEKKDLTAIADIAEFLHELDPDVDDQLEHGEDPTKETETETETEEKEDFPQEFQVDKPEEEPAFGDQPDKEIDSTEEFSTDMEATPDEEAEDLPDEEAEDLPDEEAVELPEEESFPATQEEETVVLSSEEEIQEEEEEEVEEEEEFLPTREESKVLEIPTPRPITPPTSPPSGMGEVQDFAKNISIGQALTVGNPPFSIILKNIKYTEEAEDILRILKEYGITNESNEEVFKQGLDAGSVLISQISEYAAIILTHKFRQFALEIEMGLSDEIHPPKIKEGKGLISKMGINQNKAESLDLETGVDSPEIILISTTPTLENYKINRYIGIITESALISEEEAQHLQADVDHNFGELTNRLKDKAFKLRGNAVIGITYQMAPLVPANKKGYTLTCSGNVVWVSPIED